MMYSNNNNDVSMRRMTDRDVLKRNVVNIFTDKNSMTLHNHWKCDVIVYSNSYNEDSEDGEMEERIYESGEHCFHGEKYFRLSNICLDDVRRVQLYNYSKKFLKGTKKSIGEISKMAGKNGFRLTNKEIKMWNIIGIRVQQEICRYKINNYRQVRLELTILKQNHNHKKLIYMNWNKTIKKINGKFEIKLENKILEGNGVVLESGEVFIEGKNTLGKIWMDYRDCI